MSFRGPQKVIAHPDGNGKNPSDRLLTILAAVSENHVIGKNGELPWNLPDDRNYFKQITTERPNSTVVVGRNTFEDIFARLKHPLTNRRTVVLSRNPDYKLPAGCSGSCEVHTSIGKVLALARHEEVFIAGGEHVYKCFLPYVCKMHITHVNARIPDGDAFFKFNPSEWNVRQVENHLRSTKNDFPFGILLYTRKPPRI